MELLTEEQKSALDSLHRNVVYMERETLERLLVDQYRLSFELKAALDESMEQLDRTKSLLTVAIVKLAEVKNGQSN